MPTPAGADLHVYGLVQCLLARPRQRAGPHAAHLKALRVCKGTCLRPRSAAAAAQVAAALPVLPLLYCLWDAYCRLRPPGRADRPGVGPPDLLPVSP